MLVKKKAEMSEPINRLKQTNKQRYYNQKGYSMKNKDDNIHK